MLMLITRLSARATSHDRSKLEDAEAAAFAEVTPKLRETTYGTDEYRTLLRQIKPAVQKHYQCNSHHPEHYKDGIIGMDLLDIVEMFCDWKAATLRHADGDLRASIAHNAKRFKMTPQLESIFRNTADSLDW